MLAPHLPDGANVVFIASDIEDAKRRSAKVMGMKAGRFISVTARARGEWQAGGAKIPGIDFTKKLYRGDGDCENTRLLRATSHFNQFQTKAGLAV